MNIDHPENYDRFVDTIKLNLILWRSRNSAIDFPEISQKLGISERTARRRFHTPGTLTLEEFYALCELYGKDASEMLLHALTDARKAETNE